MAITRKQGYLILGGIALVALAAWGLRPTPLDVEVAVIARGPVTVGVVAEGQTRVRERYTVAAPVSGRLSRIGLQEGTMVERGAVLARLTPMPVDLRTLAAARARLATAEALEQQAQANVTAADAQAAQALREASRRRDLAIAGALSPEAREQAELAAATAERSAAAAHAALRAATADVEAARSALVGADLGGPTGPAQVVRSPVAGRLLRVLEPSERIVAAGTPLMEIGDVGGLEVVVDVLSQDAAQIAAGNSVQLSNWGGQAILMGTVRLVEPAAFTKVSTLGVEEQRVNIIVDLPEAPAALGAGFRIEARIVTWSGTDLVTVPSSALFRVGEGWEVYVIEAGKAQRRAVVIDHRDQVVAEVTSGLAVGEQVILFPSDLIAPGVRVRAAGGGAPD